MFSEGIASEGKILTVVAVEHGTERGEQLLPVDKLSSGGDRGDQDSHLRWRYSTWPETMFVQVLTVALIKGD